MNTFKQMAQDAALMETKIKRMAEKVNAHLALGVRVTYLGVRVMKAHAMKTKIAIIPFTKTTDKKYVLCGGIENFRLENGNLITVD